jgi:hypothetical protein
MDNKIKDFLSIKMIWKSLSEVSINDNDEIQTDWLFFEKGTSRFEIWAWIEEKYNISIHELMACC